MSILTTFLSIFPRSRHDAPPKSSMPASADGNVLLFRPQHPLAFSPLAFEPGQFIQFDPGTPVEKYTFTRSHGPAAAEPDAFDDIPEDATEVPPRRWMKLVANSDFAWTTEAMAEVIIDCVNGTGSVTELDFQAAGFSKHDIATRAEAARDIAILSGRLQRPIAIDLI